MKIRQFKKEDSREMESIIKEFLDYARKTYSKKALEFENFPDSRKNPYAREILRYFQALKNSRFLVAEGGAGIAGYIVGCTEKNKNRVAKKSGHIKSFFVSGECRGKGVGKQLYNALVDWFKKQKCDHLEIDVYKGNKKTISMYKKWGFKENLIKMKKRL